MQTLPLWIVFWLLVALVASVGMVWLLMGPLANHGEDGDDGDDDDDDDDVDPTTRHRFPSRSISEESIHIDRLDPSDD